ncbi:potassium-transporting ATPase subunit KdpA [Dickeya sp. CFBP 2040]|uniref:Potassium-transporting ATPase potassium-binding subunit n=1 Tax=Dickeya poaceiphila TaxID=568768 RepID=A0A5B8I8B9_9GAMM|nr:MULTISPECIES: potassium-transporting ATPase subunit KdpA [Dickeya]NKI73577.1 potassium-transporting ATPase subunit KdpA [Dickeya sp. CFBP 2040]QDX30654.1 potassium-transporting ATPase subunit KdpA [Dickeya poaceiphila]
MPSDAFLLIVSLFAILLVLAQPLGQFMARLVEGETGVLQRYELNVARLCGFSTREMKWQHYAISILAFNLLGIALLFVMLMYQDRLPLNPQQMPGLSWHLALNTAISFVTNTNWQAYSGENTLSYFSQMVGLTVQNFLSAATGIAVAFVLMRAFARRTTQELGNAWLDLLRITLYLLLPISLLLSLFFISQGSIQNFLPYQHLTTLEGASQVLPMGPLASQEAIKMLGTNGGGFFGANSAHPFENPNALTNFVQMLFMLLIPAALCFTFGRVVNDRRQGHTLLWAMSLMLIVATTVVMYAEVSGNPHLLSLGADSAQNLEGKESRFGVLASAFFAAITTATSSGAVNAMHDSFTALGGLIPMWLMQIGEVIFGGVGSGFYGMLVFVLLTVFIAGLMIGRTPEYLGKKIEAWEMKMAALAILITPALVLLGTALALSTEAGRAGILNPGAHGFSEVLYAYSSAANNNGSAFGGLNVNTPFYNLTLGITMLLGRFSSLIPVLAIAGSLAAKKRQPETKGSLSTRGPLFISLLIVIILLISALNFIPALALGPVAEQLQSSLVH